MTVSLSLPRCNSFRKRLIEILRTDSPCTYRSGQRLPNNRDLGMHALHHAREVAAAGDGHCNSFSTATGAIPATGLSGIREAATAGDRVCVFCNDENGPAFRFPEYGN